MEDMDLRAGCDIGPSERMVSECAFVAGYIGWRDQHICGMQNWAVDT